MKEKNGKIKKLYCWKSSLVVVVHNNREETQPIYAAEKKTSL